MKPRLFAIDSSAYIFRSYFALEPRWHSNDGRPTEAVYGFAAFLLRLLAAERPAAVAAAFDESLGRGFRHRLDPEYKANRVLPDEDLAFQLAACRRVADALGIATFASDEYEADDLLATLAAAHAASHEILVVSPDKDLAQLLSPGVNLWDYGRKERLDAEAFRRELGYAPHLVPDYLALVGDPGDNIPGVPGIGAKTATAILKALGGLEQWLDDPARLARVSVRGSGRLPERVAPLRDQIRLARRLALVERAVPDVIHEPCPHWRGFDADAARGLFADLGLAGLEGRLAALANGSPMPEGGGS